MPELTSFSGGDTDASRDYDYEYTNWEAVERFADTFALRLNRA